MPVKTLYTYERFSPRAATVKQHAVRTAVLRRNGLALRLNGIGSGSTTSGICTQRFSSRAVRCAMQIGVAKNEKLHSTI